MKFLRQTNFALVFMVYTCLAVDDAGIDNNAVGSNPRNIPNVQQDKKRINQQLENVDHGPDGAVHNQNRKAENKNRVDVVNDPVQNQQGGLGQNQGGLAQGVLNPNPRRQQPGPPGGQGTLANSANCAVEIDKHCHNIPRGSDIAVLQCLQDAGDTDEVLSPPCQQELWHVKVNLTQDDRFRTAAMQFCSQELANVTLRECTAPVGTVEPGHLLVCLIDHKDNMAAGQCRQFLTRMETIVFTDFRLVGRFINKCRSEITKYECGQWDDLSGTKTDQKQGQQTGLKHSQGSTLECLLKKFVDTHSEELGKECRHEVLRLAELQADDFNLDRPLFFACRDDRERLCHDVQAGNGRVFQCLVKQLELREISYECRETMMLRLKMMQRDYKISHALVQNCQAAIVDNQCAPQGIEDQPDHFFLTYILLCLENAARQNKVIPTNCQTQMFEHRRLLMTEARMDPEVIIACSQDISSYCKQLEGGGQTLHCLMKAARMPVSATQKGLQPQCFQAVAKLLQVADVGSNYEVDRVLYNDCKPLIEGICKKEAASDTDILSCLMNNVESPNMPEDCEERLLEVQYFLARDFKLDPQLYKACHVEAASKCGYKDNWMEQKNRGKNAEQGPEKGYLVLTCLYRHAYVDEDQPDLKLSNVCTMEVRRVMRERAVSVHLMPSIEDACLADLGQHCSQKTKPGEELVCLQDNFDKLTDECKSEVKNFTLLQSKDSKLDKILNRACRPVVERYCKEFIGEDVDNGDVTECLVKNKNVPEMTNKCRAYVNHYELMSLKDYELSFKFRQACRKDIEQSCLVAGQTDKASIVRCLSELLIEKTLMGTGVEISRDCRKQMKAEYFKIDAMPVANWITFDKKFADVCLSDLKGFGCDKEETLEKAIECLKEKKTELNINCKKYIFRRERLEFGDNTFDVTLNRVCAEEIRMFCPKVDKSRSLHCLKEHKNDPAMSVDCLQVVTRRQREQASDVRLQPVLYQTCINDIKHYCKSQYENLIKQKDPNENVDLQAEIITCLRKTWGSQTGKSLALNCQKEIKKIIYESEVDPKLDPPFYQSCKSEINRLCTEPLIASDGHAGILECMKLRYKENKITSSECKKELERKVNELLFDIHLDEVLFEVCSLDLKRFCYDVPAGNGQQLKCLLMASQSTNVHMSTPCKDKLLDRKQLWEAISSGSGNLAVPSDLGGFAEIISISPARNYLMTVLLIVVFVIFVFGLCCGRATKRIRAELKNR